MQTSTSRLSTIEHSAALNEHETSTARHLFLKKQPNVLPRDNVRGSTTTEEAGAPAGSRNNVYTAAMPARASKTKGDMRSCTRQPAHRIPSRASVKNAGMGPKLPACAWVNDGKNTTATSSQRARATHASTLRPISRAAPSAEGGGTNTRAHATQATVTREFHMRRSGK